MEKCLIITYCFAVDMSVEQAIRESSWLSGEVTSSETVSDRYSFCREVCAIGLDKKYEGEGYIGGNGFIVEIDECKIGRRKYERGRIVEGCWIFGMIVRGESTDYHLEICPDNKRDATIFLLKLIKKHVAPGTEIHSNCWKGYENLEEHAYKHYTVNHSMEFVNSDSGAHTQTIESSWRVMRRFLSRGGIMKDNMADHLCEFLWRRNVKKYKLDSFEKLIEDKIYILWLKEENYKNC